METSLIRSKRRRLTLKQTRCNNSVMACLSSRVLVASHRVGFCGKQLGQKMKSQLVGSGCRSTFTRFASLSPRHAPERRCLIPTSRT